MTNKFQNILEVLPYDDPFLFVDELITVNDDEVIGGYTFKTDEYFYAGHFKNRPVTPGVILTECMAQIGLVCFGIHLLLKDNLTGNTHFAMSRSEVDFYKPVFPGETVRVFSTKEYFRFHKLKCKVIMKNSSGEVVCNGTLSGMITPNKDEN